MLDYLFLVNLTAMIGFIGKPLFELPTSMPQYLI